VFAALRLTPLDSVRAVILGQDPYHGEGQAHGLAISVRLDQRPLPPSLRNILAEWEADQNLGPAPNGSLVSWARHGVLLLSAVMTVRQGKANSHRGMGWEPISDAIIRAVSDKHEPVAFLLWGRPAQREMPLIDGRHVVIQSKHPSSLRRPEAQCRFAARSPLAPRTPPFKRSAGRRSTGVWPTPAEVEWSGRDVL